jgi:hypothetical protein
VISRRGLFRTSFVASVSQTFAAPAMAQKSDSAPILRARDFGAIGDGRADDTAALKALHDSACARGDRFAEVGPGTYFAPGLRDAANVIFVGDGQLISPYRKFVIPLGAPPPPPPPRQVLSREPLKQF